MRAPNWPREVFHGTYDATSVTLTITQALALYNCLELLLLIFVTFHRWRGLYFWSLTIATMGTISYGIGLLIEYFELAVLWVGKIFDTAGWMVMVTGQSVVLYSRLGLILANPRILRAVKWMIIINACMFHGITTILDWGRYTHNPAYARGYFYIEYIQMTCFCIQGMSNCPTKMPKLVSVVQSPAHVVLWLDREQCTPGSLLMNVPCPVADCTRIHHKRTVHMEDIEATQGHIQARSSKSHVATLYHQCRHCHSRRTSGMTSIKDVANPSSDCPSRHPVQESAHLRADRQEFCVQRQAEIGVLHPWQARRDRSGEQTKPDECAG